MNDRSDKKEGAEILPLSKWHALVGRARRLSDLDALLSNPNAASLVQAVPAQELFHAVKQVGIADCHELLELCHARQVQTFLDIDAWRRDRLAVDRIAPWLEALLAGSPDSLSRLFQGLDPEVWLLVMQPHVRVYDWSLEQLDAFGEDDVVLHSPDQVYLIEILDAESKGPALARRILELLFRVEPPEVFRRFVEALRVETHAELEEEAYRFRRGRLADLGFVEHAEAIEAYAWLDPNTARERGAPTQPLHLPGAIDASNTALPAPYAKALADASFITHVLSRVEDDAALEALAHAIVALANRVLVVDDVDVGEPEDVLAAVHRVRGYLSIGLEHLSGGDLALAQAWLSGARLIDLHRVGFSLTLELKRRADHLVRDGWLARPEARHELLDAPLRELLAWLRRRRPMLFAGLDDPARVDARDFESLADVQRARDALDDTELVGVLCFDHLRVDPLSTPPALPFSSLWRSAVIHQALGHGFRAEPVTAAELRTFLGAAFGGDEAHAGRRLSDDLRVETTLFVEGLVTSGGARVRESARRLATSWLGTMESELAGLSPDSPIDPRFVGGLWLTGAR
jgi:hypothetical protein